MVKMLKSLNAANLTQVTAKTLAQHDELMKKTETMSILMETNKMLREEKDKMEQELQQTQAKVSVPFMFTSVTFCCTCKRVNFQVGLVSSHLITCMFQVQKLESDIMPLQQANSELSEKSGMLQAEKKILEEEIKRWKARTQVSEKL